MNLDKLGDSFRDAAGYDKIAIATNPKDIIGFNYTVELNNPTKTVKIIFSNKIYKVGDSITDVTTGFSGEIVGITKLQKRDLS